MQHLSDADLLYQKPYHWEINEWVNGSTALIQAGNTSTLRLAESALLLAMSRKGVTSDFVGYIHRDGRRVGTLNVLPGNKLRWT